MLFFGNCQNSKKIILPGQGSFDYGMRQLNELEIKNIILAGELYFLSSERERYGDTISCLVDKSKRKALRFGVFDVVHIEKLFPDFHKKYEFLKKTLNTKISNKNKEIKL